MLYETALETYLPQSAWKTLSARLVTSQQLNTKALSRDIAAVICAIPYSLGEKEQ